MYYRVQFQITDEVKKQGEKKAKDCGFPTLAEYAKDLFLSEVVSGKASHQSSYADIYKEAVKRIVDMKDGTEFYVRDLLSSPPPALLGRWIHDNVKSGQIKNVVILPRKKMEPEKYRKEKGEE